MEQEQAMRHKHALVLAAALTAFMLMVLGGLITRLASPAAAVNDPLADATVQALLQAREAEYQRALSQANQQLQQAYQQPGRVQPDQAPQTAAAPDTPAVGADRAATIARELVPGATLTKQPELVMFEGTPAYEVVLNQGTLYVDANSGSVLYNGVSAAAGSGPIDEQQAAAIATTYLGGGSVQHVERERERGMAVFEVRLADGSKVYVTEESGQVAYAEIAGHEEREKHGREHGND
jgi:uncharacterized membrane protein YkoI